MPKLLIVDDDDVDRELARRCLKPLDGLELREARDGREALDLLAQDPAELVLTDLRMPRVDGLELIERLRSDFPAMPVVIMTSSGSERTAARALKLGAASYVPKTDIKSELFDTVHKILVSIEARRLRSQALRSLVTRETRFELENDPSLVSPVAGYFEDGLERLSFGSATERTQIEMALMEALSNAMIHGNLEVPSDLRRHDQSEFLALIERRRHEKPFSARRVRVAARETVKEARYEIEDEGKGFDVGRLPDPTDPENLLSLSGRGLFLIRTFMDEVEFNDSGSRITMVKSAASEVPVA